MINIKNIAPTHINSIIKNRILLFLSPCDAYLEQVKHFSRKDSFLTLLVIIVIYLSVFLFAPISLAILGVPADSINLALNDNSLLTRHFLYAILPFCIINAGLIFCLTKLGKHSIGSLGFNFKNTGKSLLFGLALGIIFILIMLLSGMRYSTSLRPERDLPMWWLVFSALITTAFVEELIFRAYIGPRFYAAFNNKFFSICVTGIIFAVLHFVPLIAVNGFFVIPLDGIVLYTAIHFVFYWLYSKYNNISGAILLHFIINFTNNFSISRNM